MSPKYLLYLYRELLAETTKDQVTVLDGGTRVVYDGKTYGVNGIHHYGGDLMVGLFGPIPS